MITNKSKTHTANIQIIDDNPENLTLLSTVLTKQGYEVRTAINGDLGLKSARKHPPDLILLDIMMPGMNGYEVCEYLKANEDTFDIPVIFLSALDQTLDKVKAFSVGGVDYITKPFQTGEVLVRIETHLALRKLQKQLEEQNTQLQQAVTRREQAEQKIRAQHAFLKTVLNSLSHPFYVINAADYTVEMANAAAGASHLQEQITCYALSHHVDQPCTIYGQPCPLLEIKKSRQPVTVEHTHVDQEGQIRYVEVYAYPIFDRAGNVVQIIEYTLDITERKQAEESLRQSEAQWRSLTESSPDHILTLDTDLNIQFANFASPGLTVAELIGTPLYTYGAEERQAEIKATLERVLKTGDPARYEMDYSPPTGSAIYYESWVVPRLSGSGQIIGLILSARDITERKQVEAQRERLAALEERERIGRELHDDLAQVVSSINVQAQVAQELIDQDKTAQAQAILAQLVQISEEANDDVRQYILGIRTSEQMPVSHTAATQPPPDFLTALDQYLDQLRQRYGLDTHVSWPDNLLASPLAPEVETQLLRIIQEGLTNVRKHAGVENARLLFTLHPDEVQVVIEDEGRGFEQGLGVGIEGRSQGLGGREKGGGLSEDIQRVESVTESRRFGDAHLSDDQKLPQQRTVQPDSADEKSGHINSIEHRRGMGTEERQRTHPLSGGGQGIVDGVGDSTDYRKETELSTDPTTANSSTTDPSSGQNAQRVEIQPVEKEIASESPIPSPQPLTPSPQPPTPGPQPPAPNLQPPTPNPQPLTPSFGLTIMRERAETIGGNLELRSSPGAGTQIIVHLPRVLETSQEETVRGLRVLLVDDHPLYLEGLRNLLSGRGVHVVGIAPNGLEAQELARKLLPDLILMDVEMPRCNGLEATRRIKIELPDIKIVMLTVAAEDETLFEALKYGAAGYLLKSLDSTQFFNLLADVMRGETVLSPTLAAKVLTAFKQEENIPDTQTEPASVSSIKTASFPKLTSRQTEILTLVAQGLTYREIGAKVYLSQSTVKYHMGQILERLQLRNRREAAMYAQKHIRRT